MIKSRLLLAISGALILPLAVSSTYADESNQGYYLAPSLSYAVFDKEYELEDGAGATISFGYQYDSRWATEVALLMTEAQYKTANTSIDGEHYQLRLDGLYTISSADSKINPYLVAGIGHGRWELDNDFENKQTQFNAGFGIKSNISSQVALRSDLRAVFDIDEDELNGLFNLGISYFFKKPEPTPSPVVDTDEDSIPDDIDQCRATPKEATVSSDGCPIDTDQDGVADYLDQCPNTAKGIAVTLAGCAKDTDQDGIPDSRDACNATPIGAKVDDSGCRVKLLETVEISLQLNFKSGSNEVLDSHIPEISKVGKFLQQYPDSKVVIEGHTDSRGSARFNQQLSKKRASSVREFIIEKFGVDADRISAKGIGEVSPIADNSTAEGRAKNRRVVAVIKATVEK